METAIRAKTEKSEPSSLEYKGFAYSFFRLYRRGTA